MRRVLFIAVIALIATLYLQKSEQTQPDGVLVPSSPIQAQISPSSFQFEGYRIERLAGFQLEARVLGQERYSLDRESDLARYDLALGWGPMSDNRVLEQIEISQSGRWYHWKTQQLPIPRRDIERSSANMHMIAANDWIEEQIADAVPGSLIRLEGFLVRAVGNDGWRWQSSLTRDDTGQGACELIFVESFEILDRT
ncbi:hypothetical protein ADIMK_0519 [Marinobacterium lacunae]|uniref:Uncharacterized protein n=1 Tax=Marinobacterium lacunae TaxID=1232683 RepID=A0A081G457_9GAMM|nr:hypothetical protein [Marinobacterium lacunae]KEA65562.1 hypothetical protein ADIMK_0519 [Marinobacterium lacunae]